MTSLLLAALAGLYPVEVPPADMDSALMLLRNAMTTAEPSELGMFFAEIGLEASPDEVVLWGDSDFLDILIEFTSASSDTMLPDSLVPLLEELPLQLLVDPE